MNKKLLLIPIVLLATTGVTLAFGLSKEKKITIDEIYSPKLTTVENKQPVKNKQITNILIAGIGGENHDGGMLTDTIIFTSIDMQNNKIATLNIPRDLYVDLGDKYGYNKINSANAFGEQEKPGSGMLFLQNEVEKILNQDIDYYIRIDFDGFKDIIDTLGGITINVERSFVDNQYPTENFGYKTIYFQAGPQVMNGERALEYTRSRHGTNGEGSDFARSKRQQQVIEAVKDKILSEINTYNPTKIISIFDALKRHISTNLSYKDIYNLYKIADNFDNIKVINRTLSDTNGYVYTTTTIDGVSIVKPVGNNFNLIQDLAIHIFDEAYDPIKQQLDNLPKIVILNGTNITGLASKITEDIKNTQEFNIYYVGNYDIRNVEDTILFDASGNTPLSSLNLLNQKFNAKILSRRLNIFNSYDNIELQTDSNLQKLDQLQQLYSQADLVLILGSNITENKASI
ncbi:MAG TPA: LCP family protein [bacterium]|nr:LCP family protein [bacterium]